MKLVACVASVSVLFQSKERPRIRILGFGRARNETRAKSHPLPAYSRHFSRVPRSLLRNNTETLATQAMKLVMHVKGDLSSNMCGTRELFVAFRENQ